MRAIRDLRDLVNVSRLTYRDDSENELEDDFTKSIASMPLNKPESKIVKNEIFKSSSTNNFFKNSSLQNSKLVPTESKSNRNVYLLNSVMTNSSSSMILRERDQLLDRNSLPLVQFSISQKKPLPPLKTKSDIDKIEPTKEIVDKELESEVDLCSSSISRFYNGNFDEVLTFIDASVVSEWLNRANRLLKKMLKWHRDNSDLSSTPNNKLLRHESFIMFCNFWLGNNEQIKLTDKQRRSLIEMEYYIINEEVMQAFQVGLDCQSISMNSINQLLKAVFKEYPIQLLSFRGPYVLLDFVDILCSDRDNEYKKLLSDVKCRTVNKQYAQWLLSIRSFALINMCWSIIKFYRKTFKENLALSGKNNENDFKARLSCLSAKSIACKNEQSKSSSNSSLSSISSVKSDESSKNLSSFVNNQRLKSAKIDIDKISRPKYSYYLEAIFKNDFPDVLHYLISTKKYDPCIVDEQGRTLIFRAVMSEKPKILSYLVKRWPSIDINKDCESGNTPLHAAVNKGNMKLVEILLESIENKESNKVDDKINIKLDINKQNSKCMNATPLHLAVWNDFNEIAIKLVQNGANPFLMMNGKSTALDLAKENSNQVLSDLLLDYYKSKNIL